MIVVLPTPVSFLTPISDIPKSGLRKQGSRSVSGSFGFKKYNVDGATDALANNFIDALAGNKLDVLITNRLF